MHEVDWHRQMLADRQRVLAWGRAVHRAVRPGDVVVDLGTGSGVLALIACRAGARRVYAVERGRILEVARQVVAANGAQDRVVFVPGESTQVELPEPADLAIAEVVGSFGLEERIVESLSDARRRHLKPGGRLLPDHLDLWVAPSSQGRHYHDWPAHLQSDWGLDLGPLARLSCHVVHGLRADAARFLGPPARLLACDLRTAEPGGLGGATSVTVSRPGPLCGWIGWFSAWAQGELVLSTRPPLAFPSWQHLHFPIGEPVEVAPGAVLRLEMALDNPLWSWRCTVSRPPVEREMADFLSYPASVFLPASGARRPDGRAAAASDFRGISSES
ncbi:MAG: 50S ribosomal protein L11 methyltransferase [Candidatus Latescibacterota bacterium]